MTATTIPAYHPATALGPQLAHGDASLSVRWLRTDESNIALAGMSRKRHLSARKATSLPKESNLRYPEKDVSLAVTAVGTITGVLLKAGAPSVMRATVGMQCSEAGAPHRIQSYT